jgi:D-alanyl-lipoteichoic acid acyltransferase DltB (MBOAT superfamily)
MLFHSLDYILFLAIAVTGFWALIRHDRWRLLFLFLMSCRFYMVWNPYYVGLVLSNVVIDYVAQRRIAATDDDRKRKAWLGVSLAWNLGTLGMFKYFNFFVGAAADTLGLLGLNVPRPYLDVLLPVGISFYTFQTLSCVIDVYRRRYPPAQSLLHYGTYLLYFPHLVAGPIVRGHLLLPQLLTRPPLTPGMVGQGLFLIIKGLFKKVVIADFLSVNLVDRMFDNPSAYTSLEVLVALYGYTMQIYCDFSGYTDVARGSAMLMGYTLPENFDRPYLSTSPAAFWRRWHITLSSWLRDYVYFPLGGSKGSPVRTYFNLWLTLFLIGIWHGASWNFVIYGALHGGAMVLHRYFYKRSGRTNDTHDPKWLMVLKIMGTFHFVVLSRILFRAPTLGSAGAVTAQLLKGSYSLAQVSWMVWMVLFGSFLIHFAPKRYVELVRDRFVALPAPLKGVVLAVTAAVLMKMASSQVVPYIYFQF